MRPARRSPAPSPLPMTSSSITGVEGTLIGYRYGTLGYVGGSATDAISWIWALGGNYSSTTNTFSNFLADGTDSSNYSNFIGFEYTYASGNPTLVPAVASTSSAS